MTRTPAPTRLLRRRARERYTAISTNRGGGVIETVLVRERHEPGIAWLVGRRRSRNAYVGGASSTVLPKAPAAPGASSPRKDG